MNHKRTYLVLTLIMLLFMAAPGMAQSQTTAVMTSDFEAEVANAWYNLHHDLVTRTWGFSPPVAARAFGYTGVTLYEAVVHGMPEHQSLANQLNELRELPQPEAGQDYHWGVAANSALADITRALFPTANEPNRMAIEALYAQFAEQFRNEADEDTFSRSDDYGRQIAAAIYEWSMSDGAHESFHNNYPAEYEPPVGDGLWVRTQRTKGNPQPAMQPYWGNIRPFVLGSGDECAPPPPPAYSEDSQSAFYGEAVEVYDVSRHLTAEQLEIARYWADDPFRTSTPAGHSISILTQVLEAEGATLDAAAEAYARLGIALADSFISCWYVKYQHNLLRPVTYIQEIIDANWIPALITPPFPEYPSGHSVQSGAAARVLTAMFGEDYAFTDHTHDDWGLPSRSFNSFAEFAEEAAISRLYGGIHYRAAIEYGLEQGNCVAARVNALQFRRDA